MGNKKDNIKKDKYQETPIYPTEFHTRTFPQRVYIWIIERFVSIACILVLLSAIQAIYIFAKISTVEKSNIYFVYWDEYENRFKEKEFIDEFHKNEVKIPIYQITAQETLEKAVVDRYQISSNEINNEKKWCGCEKEILDRKKAAIFTDDCFICRHSSNNEWTIFSNGILQENLEIFNSGKTRKVVLLETNILNSYDAYLRPKETFFNKIATEAMNFFNVTKKKEEFLAQYIMEVKFALIQYDKNGKKEWAEILSSIAQITSRSKDYGDRVYGFVIDELDTNFVPQKEMYFKKYLEELRNYE
ncbi:MAG: hypothetical protein N4A44_02180 [Alphaproteobacteria bacterium]|jgi:hypothetical protein|nr:hypothetical protein [Alphaproteobacteria bacterium]